MASAADIGIGWIKPKPAAGILAVIIGIVLLQDLSCSFGPGEKAVAAELRRATENYVAAFNSASLERTAEFFSEGFTLTDPGGTYSPRDAAREAVKGIFDGVGSDPFSFRAVHIYADPERVQSTIEFELSLGGKKLVGADIIQWDKAGKKMKSMRAYVYEKQGSPSRRVPPN